MNWWRPAIECVAQRLTVALITLHVSDYFLVRNNQTDFDNHFTKKLVKLCSIALSKNHFEPP